MEQAQIIVSDRYSATGTPRPDPATMCFECEGMGCYPVNRDTTDPTDKAAWLAEDAKRRNARAFFRVLWRHRELWFWRSMFGDLFANGIRNWACDDWHFVECPHCHGTRLRNLEPDHA